jgi:hypothetical protein
VTRRASIPRSALVRRAGGRPGPIPLAGLLVVGLLAACDRGPTSPAASPASLEVRGVTVGDWSRFGIVSPDGRAAVDRAAAVGATAVVYLATVHQRTARSSRFDSRVPPSPDFHAYSHAVRYANRAGLDVVLKLHVDVEDGTWRGFVRPDDPVTWFAEYREFAVSWAEEAASTGTSQLVVGTELAGTIEHEARWREVVAAVRERFAGEVLYAASWDEAERVPFWDALDGVGVDFWFPVADRANPGRLEILAAWQPWLERLERLGRRTDLPIWLTEIGYASCDGAGLDPARIDPGGRPDPAEQADLYWAALHATADVPELRGIYWWNWDVGGAGGPGDRGYTPLGKPAEAVLREAWESVR